MCYSPIYAYVPQATPDQACTLRDAWAAYSLCARFVALAGCLQHKPVRSWATAAHPHTHIARHRISRPEHGTRSRSAHPNRGDSEAHAHRPTDAYTVSDGHSSAHAHLDVHGDSWYAPSYRDAHKLPHALCFRDTLCHVYTTRRAAYSNVPTLCVSDSASPDAHSHQHRHQHARTHQHRHEYLCAYQHRP